MTGLVVGEDGLARPAWAAVDPLLRDYYDTEWGMPVRDEQGLFERLSLEAFQGHASPLDERTHTVRPYTGELASTARLRELMRGSSFWSRSKPPTVQDPMSDDWGTDA